MSVDAADPRTEPSKLSLKVDGGGGNPSYLNRSDEGGKGKWWCSCKRRAVSLANI